MYWVSKLPQYWWLIQYILLILIEKKNLISGIVSAVEMVVIMGIFVKRILIVAETNGIERANALEIFQIKIHFLSYLVILMGMGTNMPKNMDLGENISRYIKTIFDENFFYCKRMNYE